MGHSAGDVAESEERFLQCAARHASFSIKKGACKKRPRCSGRNDTGSGWVCGIGVIWRRGHDISCPYSGQLCQAQRG